MGPLISADQRETVGSYVPDDAPVAIRGSAPDGPGFWFAPTVLAPVSNSDRAATEEIFGPVACVIPFDDEAEAVRARQRHDLRALGLDLDPRRRPGAAGRAGDRDRRALDQLEQLGAGDDAVRRLQAVGRRPRARPGRARALHRGQERLLRDRGGLDMAGTARGQGLRDHRRRERDRRRVGAAVRRGGRAGRRRRPQPERRSASSRSRPTSPTRTRSRRSTRGSSTSSATSTCSSTTPASTRTTTPRWSRSRSRPGSASRTSTCARSSSAASTASPTCSTAGGGSVINTASFVAVMGAAVSQISYTASKGAVLAMSREMGVEFARRGVRVNALCPGPVNTPLLQELFASDPAKAARRLVHLPMGRFAEAERDRQRGALPRQRRVARTSPPRPSSSTAGSRAPTSRPRPASSDQPPELARAGQRLHLVRGRIEVDPRPEAVVRIVELAQAVDRVGAGDQAVVAGGQARDAMLCPAREAP